ncbi:hypothetical protein CUJ83_06985 [Methanocella sp. CWC-04]|uniref:Uncharacterized protein n=1 Tax=Methanooceanicella nereidis TaxID=2052831 RepID=A0AAP2RCS9_9EURY|nr:hypothetical protein [Methanocella sp. CWC-04]MCD1294742.1 hypothetical protein [Methanocella sp. CWC-04]
MSKIIRDDSGQFLLTSAFILAFAIIAITLMLNNVIFSSNMAYVGMMDQSRYDALSLKQATAKEISYAYNYTKGDADSSRFDKYTDDYEKALNGLYGIKSKQVTITSTPYRIPISDPLAVTETESQLSIIGRNSNLTYKIFTGNPLSSGTTPGGTSSGYKINIIPSKYNVTVGLTPMDYVLLTVEVFSNSSTPVAQANVDVTMHKTLAGSEFRDLSGTAVTVVTTDSTGKATLKYVSAQTGTDTIYATIGAGNRSNDINIFCAPIPSACSHVVGNTTYTKTYAENEKIYATGGGNLRADFVKISYDIYVNGLYNFSNFKVDITLNPDSNNTAFATSDDSGSFTQALISGTNYNKNINVRIQCLDNDYPYFANLTMRISGTCNICGTPGNRPLYEREVIIHVRGNPGDWP